MNVSGYKCDLSVYIYFFHVTTGLFSWGFHAAKTF